MLIVHNIGKFVADWESSSLTLGVFDGIHLGHQELLKRIQKQKDSYKRVLVTYHPHPDLVLKKEQKNMVQNSIHTKKNYLCYRIMTSISLFL